MRNRLFILGIALMVMAWALMGTSAVAQDVPGANDPQPVPSPVAVPTVPAPPAPQDVDPGLIGLGETPLARDERISSETATLLTEVDREVEAMLKGRIFIPPDTRPLLFTPFQMGLLDQLRKALKEAPPTPIIPPVSTSGDNTVVEDAKDLEPEVLPATVRVLALGGIMMQSDSDWTVWFNGQRLKPGRLPPEMKEIRVSRDYVDLIWLDKKNNTYVPLRLRPNQRFNLDERLFLSGSEAPETVTE